MSKAFETLRRAYTGLSLILLNTVLFLVVVIILLELVAGWLLNRQATAQSAAVSLTESAYKDAPWKDQFFKDVAAYQAATGGRQVYEPYSLWKNPDFASATFTVADGYRKTVSPPHSVGDSIVRVWLFGGSTMFCADAPDEWTIASQLSLNLHKQYPTKHFEVSNYGLPGFVNDQEAVLLSKLLMGGKRPDLVIFYDGFNEGHLKVGMVKPMAHGFYELYDQIYRSIKERLWANLVWKSSLLTLVMRSRSDGIKFEKNPTVLQERAEAVCTHYTSTFTFVQNLAKTYGFQAVFFWQPSLLTTAKPLTQEESALRNIVEASNGQCYKILHATVRKRIFDNPAFAQLPIYDINNAFDTVPLPTFVDYAHLSYRGNEAIAGSIAQCLLTKNLIQP